MREISDAKLQKVIGFTPHPAQKEILECPEREILVCAGRRFGKSLVASYLALKELLGRDKRIWLVAPFYSLAQINFDKIAFWLGKIVPTEGAIQIRRRPVPTITTALGSILECKSAENPISLLGRATNLIILDEAARIPKNVWEQYLFPTTHDNKGRTIMISTPRGMNWFYHKFLELKEKKAAFHFTSKDNPYFSKEEWERARKTLPERVFLQEYLASFLPDASSVFRKVDEIVSKDSLEDPQPGHMYLLGVDLGKFEDFTVLIVIDQNTYKVVYFDRFGEIDYPLQKERIVAVAKKYNNAKIIMESRGAGDPVVDDLRREGLIVEDFKTGASNKVSGVSKMQLVDKLSIFIEQKAITIPNIPELIDELKAFSYEVSEKGIIKYSAPQGLHDDCVMALAFAVYGLFSSQKPLSIEERSMMPAFKKFEYL